MASLSETIKRKDVELQAMDERYKKYIEKAKNVIKSLDPKQNPGSAAEVSDLRDQLLEKHKIIEEMEVKFIVLSYFIDFFLMIKIQDCVTS